MGSTTNEELENLDLNLKKVQEKFLNEWTGESFRKARLEDKENHENKLIGEKGTYTILFMIHESGSLFCQSKFNFLLFF